MRTAFVCQTWDLMKPTEEFVDWVITAGQHQAGLLKALTLQLDHNRLVDLLGNGAVRVVSSRNGPFSVVSAINDNNNPSPISGCFELHTDGLYCSQIPDLVIMYCTNPGEKSIPTVVSDTRIVVDKLRSKGLLDTFRGFAMAYQFGDGCSITWPIIASHPLTAEPVIHMGTHGVLQPLEGSSGKLSDLPFREVVNFAGDVFQWIEEAVVYEHDWSKNDLLIIDNHTFLHGRRKSAVDLNRSLIRIWLAAESSPNQS